MIITQEPFGMTASGDAVTCYHLKNQTGMVVSALDFGCTIQRILVPDQSGKQVDVVLGYDTLTGYENGSCYFGALVGRYAGRIRGARFTLHGKRCTLIPNQGNHHLHGTFSKTVFSSSVEENALVFFHASSASEEGFPGNLAVTVRYSLTDDHALILDYEAEADADTVLNLTNHSYFNLNGHGTVQKHRLLLRADCCLENDAETLPTGRLIPVSGTPMDFRAMRTVGEGLGSPDAQIRLCGGYDHHYVLTHEEGELYRFAELIGDETGIRMTAETTQPGVQLYTGNYVQDDTAPLGKGGVRYERHAGLCLETQHAPDSPNFPAFPSVILRPGERYHQRTVYRFER